jgi:hypothetical protein
MSVLLPARVLFAHDSDAGNEVKTPLCQILVVGVLFEVVDWTVGVRLATRLLKIFLDRFQSSKDLSELVLSEQCLAPL